MTTIKIVPDFPGAYGAKVDAWERQKRKEIALMPEREGYRPGIVLKPRPTATITATAVQVSEEERAQFGKHYIGVQEGGSITPRKLSSCWKYTQQPVGRRELPMGRGGIAWKRAGKKGGDTM